MPAECSLLVLELTPSYAFMNLPLPVHSLLPPHPGVEDVSCALVTQNVRRTVFAWYRNRNLEDAVAPWAGALWFGFWVRQSDIAVD